MHTPARWCQALGVKVDLFSMVFGESVLNDAVAIVLSRTLLSFNGLGAEVDAESIQAAAISFVVIFVGSTLVGVFFGCLCSLLFKFLGLRMHAHFVNLENALTFVFPWAAYYTTEALELSGIVAIMMAGVVMALFVRNSLSERSAHLTRQVYKAVAQLAETYVFVYLGMAFVVYPIFVNVDVPLLLVSLGACFVGRLHIYVGSWLNNCVSQTKISPTYMFIMWFSGLRGGVAFALASVSYANNDFGNHCGGLADVGPLTAEQAKANGETCELTDSLAILQTTLLIAAFTIFVFGGAITNVAIYFRVLEDRSKEGLKKARMDAYVAKDDPWAKIEACLAPILSVGKKKVQNKEEVKAILMGEKSTFVGSGSGKGVEEYFKQENEWMLANVLDGISAAQARIRGKMARKGSKGKMAREGLAPPPAAHHMAATAAATPAAPAAAPPVAPPAAPAAEPGLTA